MQDVLDDDFHKRSGVIRKQVVSPGDFLMLNNKEYGWRTFFVVHVNQGQRTVHGHALYTNAHLHASGIQPPMDMHMVGSVSVFSGNLFSHAIIIFIMNTCPLHFCR